jgi:hypothetical protein
VRIAITDQVQDFDFIKPGKGPWKAFFDVFEERGHQLVSIESNPEVLIFMNVHPRLLRKIRRNKSECIKVLILWESPASCPVNFNKLFVKLFDFVITPSQTWHADLKPRYFQWPQDTSTRPNANSDSWHKRSEKFVMLNANKFSLVSEELYSTRRKIIEILGEEVDVFGKGWNSTVQSIIEIVKGVIRSLTSRGQWSFGVRLPFVKVRSYKGVAESKSVMSKYKYAVITENHPSYISEKLVDAITHGCVPIYVGPRLKDYGFPPGIAFELNRGVTMKEEILSLRGNSKLVHEIRENCTKFVSSDFFIGLRNDVVLRDLALKVCNLVEERV